MGYTGEGVLGEEDGWTVIKKIERRIGSIPLRIGTIARQTIMYRGKEILLEDFIPAQRLVNIRVEKKFF